MSTLSVQRSNADRLFKAVQADTPLTTFERVAATAAANRIKADALRKARMEQAESQPAAPVRKKAR
ncbi:hypothetical protein [Aureimonas sp. AU20]|uniref:hypothetical protein n=1 Tax=Aureimonas sp. AU20 TaxID=1349819 RepID=UPI000721AC1B|nr:hypothetical protein [Aureimonas sp. AU20]ALN74554.1 hypothetical protein M673_17705 [Aureimonas sp. AU20]